MKKPNSKPFILRMSIELFKQLETSNEKAIMMAILSFSDNGRGECWAGQRKIAEQAGCSPASVVSFKKKWIKKGVLEKTGRKKCIGGWSDVLRLSGQPLTPSGQNQPFKRSPGDHKQLKETIKLKLSEEEEKLAIQIAKWATERAYSPSTKSVNGFIKDLVPYLKKFGCDRIKRLWENETSNYIFWNGLKSLTRSKSI